MARTLTKKERGFVRDVIKTGNGTQAALANYDTTDENVAAVIASENLSKPKIQKAIADRLPDDLLERVHTEGLAATRVISANITYGDADEKTDDFIEVPDHPTRAKFLDMAYKVRGTYAPEKSQSINLNVDASLPPSDTEAIRREYEEKLKAKLMQE